MAESITGVSGDQAAARSRQRGGRRDRQRDSRPGPPLLRVLALPDGPVRVRCTAPDALSNLVAVLELAADGRLRCAAGTRRPLAATVRLVEDALVAGDYYGGPEGDPRDGGEPIAAFAWPMLLQAGGLARLDGTGLEPTPRGQAVLARPSYRCVGALWDRWRGSVSQDEFSRVEAIRGQRKTGILTPVASRRAAVAAGLAALEPGAWVDVDAFFAILRTQAAPLAVTTGPLARWALYLDDPRHGSLGPAGWKAWTAVEGRYALCVLFEYAATLGVVDVAYAGPRGARRDHRELWGAGQRDSLSRYDGLTAIRVSELGAAILHDPDPLAALDALGLPLPRRMSR
ncbi:MAG TPA: hypothetical protein VFV73_32360 [Streptosporangiaceae bacterium]|nr:hypothetical protein [Streptosporangiaceae bacterium]